MSGEGGDAAGQKEVESKGEEGQGACGAAGG